MWGVEFRAGHAPTQVILQKFLRANDGDAAALAWLREMVVTWNIYGAVTDNKATFGDVDEFIKWRAALMKLSVRKLRLDAVTEPLGAGEYPYRMVKVHDYRSVSFFRMDPDVRAASRRTIETFFMAYPELLAHKYSVNVPAIMGWVFGAMKLFLAPATVRKFHSMASGAVLAAEMGAVGAGLPEEYGGSGPGVAEQDVTVRLGGMRRGARRPRR